MPGLIPLMLNPVAAGNRASVVFAPSPSTKPHSRGQSMNHLPLAVHSPQSASFSPSASPTLPQRSSLPVQPKSKPVKRLSFASPATLSVLPYTPEDWRRAISEVKRQHMNRRYRACFTRCNEILDNIKDTSHFEPAYLISLHFYAATAMEMCARPLIAPSTYRDSLLQQARSHYDLATSLIRSAEESVQLKTRGSFSFLSSPSLHSPSGSVSSRAWTSETGFSSPTPSVCSSEDLNARLHQLYSPSPPSPASSPRPARKKVSFELPKEDPLKWEPCIRPDSPTLGFDDEYFTAALSRRDLPEVPKRSRPVYASHTVERVEDEDATPRASKDFYYLNQSSPNVEADAVRRSLPVDNSAGRYCAHLTSLKSQVARHRAHLDAILQTPPLSVENDSTDRSPRPVTDETHSLERKARIERLRKSGWQRKRFDPSRYEALRNAALAELN